MTFTANVENDVLSSIDTATFLCTGIYFAVTKYNYIIVSV